MALPGLGGKPSVAPLPGLGGRPSVGPLPGAGPLPGMGPLPGAGPLPGLGSRPGGPIPGLGGGGPLPGMRPPGGASGLPGAPIPAAASNPAATAPGYDPSDPFGSQPKPGQPAAQQAGGGLPGLKAGPAGVPPFLQKKRPDDEVRQKEASARARQAEADARIAAALSETSIDDAPMMAGRTKKTLIIAAIVAAVLGLGVGLLLGTGISGRQELNIAIRDALIIEHDLKEAGKTFNEVQTMITTAIMKAGKHEFDPAHLTYLKNNVHGNPMKPSLLTERNYKRFDSAAVQWLVDYFKKWDQLYGLIQVHRRATEYDEKSLLASRANAVKLAEAQYGVVFAKDKNLGFIGNVVLLGAGDGTKFQVQADAGSPAIEKILYNPEGEDSELSKEPEKFFVQLGQESKNGLLANATQSQFKKYVHRLKEISDLMKGMSEIQQNILDKISAIGSQAPAWGVDPDPEAGLEDYIRRSAAAAAQGE